MALSPESKPNPKRYSRRREGRRFYGLSDRQQLDVLRLQQKAIEDVFDALERYARADTDARIMALNEAIAEETIEQIDAEFPDGVQ